MKWKIKYSDQARRDIRDIYEYLAYEQQEPEMAAKQVQKIMKSIRRLDEMPMRYSIYKEEPWKSQGVRYYPEGGQLIFYQVEREKRTVNIVRVMNERRNVKGEVRRKGEPEYRTGNKNK